MFNYLKTIIQYHFGRSETADLLIDLLSIKQFAKAPGGAEHHHTYEGGLLQHTGEVVKCAMMMGKDVLDNDELENLLIASTLHDYCKVFEYKLEDNGSISKLQYQKMIGHVAGSWYFMMAEFKGVYTSARLERIGHIMLAHHGRLEWRSPVEPMTKAAHILHAADMMSMQGLLGDNN